ncbi:MAG: hypothetical protein KW806_02150 [Candidatus Yanofskybacteria bacterium]|nr:hypothetical protein [Candidatus Yanofskybacteria bacterium]
MNLIFKISRFTLALFPNPKVLNFDKLRIASEIRDKLKGVIDEEPTILPIPSDVPPEFPRIILESKNGFSSHISPARVDINLNFEEGEEETDLKVISSKFVDSTKNFFSYFTSEFKIGRAGFVVDLFADLNESSLELLKKLFNEKSYVYKNKKLYSLNLRINERENISSLDLNKVVDLDVLRKKSDLSNDQRLKLQYDINTLSEKLFEYEINSDNISSILEFTQTLLSQENLNQLLSLE